MPPKSLDPKKLPPGHRIFKDGNKSQVTVFEGQLYDGRGRRLEHNWEYLKQMNYTLIPEMMSSLMETKQERPVKKCCNDRCAKPIEVVSKFCQHCGEQQPNQLLSTADDPKLMEFLRFCHSDNPFGVMHHFTGKIKERVQEYHDLQQRQQVTPESVVEDAKKEAMLPLSFVSGVPGDSAVNKTNPTASIKPVGVFKFQRPEAE